MKRFLIFSIMSLILYAFPTSSLSFMTWDIEKIADRVDIGTAPRSIALDGNNNPGIAYFDPLSQRLLNYVRKIPDGSWVYAIVDPISDCGDHSMDLQFNPLTGFPEISYICTQLSDSLRFAKFDGNLWNSDSIELNDNDPRIETSLAYHPTTNYPAIAYNADNLHIGFVEYNGSSWVGGTQWDLSYPSGRGFELKFLPNGNPLIAYRSWSDLLVAEGVNGDWVISTADHMPDLSLKHSWQALGLELDSNGLPHIAYIDADAFLRYASFIGMLWDVEETGIACRRVDFDFDSNDNPFFFCEPNSGGIYSVYKKDNNWDTYLIESTGYAMSNVAVDDLGDAHISFMRKDGVSEIDRNLYYAKGTPFSSDNNSFPWLLFYPAFTRPSE